MVDLEKTERLEELPEDFTIDDYNAMMSAIEVARGESVVARSQLKSEKEEKDKILEMNRTLINSVSTKKTLKQPEEYLAEMFK